jgi:hypothetical protein
LVRIDVGHVDPNDDRAVSEAAQAIFDALQEIAKGKGGDLKQVSLPPAKSLKKAVIVGPYRIRTTTDVALAFIENGKRAAAGEQDYYQELEAAAIEHGLVRGIPLSPMNDYGKKYEN